MPRMVRMQVPSAVATRSVGRETLGLCPYVDGGIGLQRGAAGTVRGGAAEVACVLEL